MKVKGKNKIGPEEVIRAPRQEENSQGELWEEEWKIVKHATQDERERWRDEGKKKKETWNKRREKRQEEGEKEKKGSKDCSLWRWFQEPSSTEKNERKAKKGEGRRKIKRNRT